MAAPAPGAPAQQQPNEFDLARKRAQQQSNAAVQQQRDAIKRRAAAQGGLNSGAFIKQEQQVMQQGQEQLGQANEQIDTAQRAEARRIKEIEDQRAFEAGEAEKNRAYDREKFDKTFAWDKEKFGKVFDFDKEKFDKTFGLQKEGLNLEKEKFGWAKDTDARDFDKNSKTNVITTLISGKNSGLSEPAIKALVDFYENGTPIPAGWPNLQGPAAAPTTVEQTMNQTGPNGERPVSVQSDNRGTIAIYQDSNGRYVYRNGRKQYI